MLYMRPFLSKNKENEKRLDGKVDKEVVNGQLQHKLKFLIDQSLLSA